LTFSRYIVQTIVDSTLERFCARAVGAAGPAPTGRTQNRLNGDRRPAYRPDMAYFVMVRRVRRRPTLGVAPAAA
jgi:hypothetical protein